MTDELEDVRRTVADLAAGIVCVYVANNRLPLSDLPKLIASVQAALNGLPYGQQPTAAPDLKVTEAQIRKSITPDALISFIDGKLYKVLKRHLRMHGLDGPAYRGRYGLPPDYPMVAPSYSARRADISRGIRSNRSRP
jgi:predicted transcriptional regulator